MNDTPKSGGKFKKIKQITLRTRFVYLLDKTYICTNLPSLEEHYE